jgi:MFS family permease
MRGDILILSIIENAPACDSPQKGRFCYDGAVFRFMSLRPLARHLDRACGPFSPRRLAGLIWFWMDGAFSQAQASSSTDYIPLFALAAGASAGVIGVLAAVGNLVSIAGYLAGAQVAWRLRQRKPFVLIAGGWASRLMILLLALLPLVMGNGALLVFFIIAVNAAGLLFGSLCNPPWASMAADLVPVESRGRYFASRNLAMGLVALFASPAAGWMVRTVNTRASHHLLGYQVTLLLAFLFGMLSTYSYSRIPEPPSGVPGRLRKRTRNVLDLLRRNPAFTWLAASSFVWGFSLNVASPFFNVYIVTGLHGNSTNVGIATGVSALTGLAGQALFGSQSDRRGNRAVLVLTGILIPFLPLAWVLARAPWHVYIINTASGVLWAGYNLAGFNMLLELSPLEEREAGVALYQSVVSASAVLGPLVGGLLIATAGYHAAFIVSGVGRFAGTLLFILFVRPARRGVRPGG